MEFGPLRAEPAPGAGGVVEVVIDHPPTNLVDGAFIVGLTGLLDGLEADGTARVVVFSSADPDFFLMHGDVYGILAIPRGSHTPAKAPNVAAALFERLHRSPLVTVGLLDGTARGGGTGNSSPRSTCGYGSRARRCLGQPEVAMGILARRGRDGAPARTCSGAAVRLT